jgi:PEGA domain-containing protein
MRPLVASLLLASIAAAQDAAVREEARNLLHEGNSLYDKGDFPAALDRFRRAYAKLPSPKILLNIGTTLRRIGKEGEAAEAYELYLRRIGPEVPADKRAQVGAVLHEIDEKLGRIRIEVNVEGASVRLDGEAKGVSPLGHSVRVDPGIHRAEAERDGYQPDMGEIEVEAGQERLIFLRLREVPPPVVEPVPPPPVPAPPPPGPGVPPPGPPTPAQPSAMPRREPEVVASDVSETPRDFTHAWRLSLAAREDIVLRTDVLGAFSGVGLGFGLGDYVELSFWGLRGRASGGRATGTVYALPHERIKPMAVLGATLLDVAAPYRFEPLFHGGGGVTAEVTRWVGFALEVSYERFLVSLRNNEIDDGHVLVSLSMSAKLWQ